MYLTFANITAHVHVQCNYTNIYGFIEMEM